MSGKSNTKKTLTDLINTINNNLSKIYPIEGKEIRKWVEPYTKIKCMDFNYNKSIRTCAANSEPHTQNRYYWLSFDDYVHRLKKDFDIIDDFVTVIKNEIPEDDITVLRELNSLREPERTKARPLIIEKRAKSLLQNFLIFLFYEQNLNNSSIDEIIERILYDIHCCGRVCSLKIWITGIWLNNDYVNISPQITIRKPIKSDLEFKNSINPNFQSVSIFDLVGCSAIVELRDIMGGAMEVWEYQNKILQALQLYNLGSISVIFQENIPSSIVLKRSIQYNSHGRFNRSDLNFQIQSIESEKAAEFIETLMMFLPQSTWQTEGIKPNPIFIAIERYLESINSSSIIDSKITMAITAFEALFLEGNDRSELSHKLSQRVAYISKLFGESPTLIYKDMKSAYNIRSTYIHGAILKPKDRKGLPDVYKTILINLRRSILLFIGLCKTTKKEDIIKKIDESILDKETSDGFISEIHGLRLLELTRDSTNFLTSS